MAKKNESGIPSQTKVPGQTKYDHGIPFIGPTTAMPLSQPNGPTPIKQPAPSRFNEFMNESHTNGKGGE